MMFADTKKNKASIKDFTGSFDSGKATDIASFYIEHQKSQMILPVAGPQTGDVVGVIASTNNKGKVFTFGVDVDQSKVYKSDYFLGSAIKGIYASNAFALNQLQKKPSPKFELFNMALANKTGPFKTFIETNLKPKLEKRYTASEIKVMIKPTGFSPSATMSTSVEMDKLYVEAQGYVSGTGVLPGLSASVTQDNAKKAFKIFGGFEGAK